jgi:hypothetical protein
LAGVTKPVGFFSGLAGRADLFSPRRREERADLFSPRRREEREGFFIFPTFCDFLKAVRRFALKHSPEFSLFLDTNVSLLVFGQEVLTTKDTKDTKPEFQCLTNQALVTLVSFVVKTCVHNFGLRLASSR